MICDTARRSKGFHLGQKREQSDLKAWNIMEGRSRVMKGTKVDGDLWALYA